MRYELKAIAPDGRIESRSFQALDRDSAVRQLESRGYSVLSARVRGAWLPRLRRTASRFPVLLFTQEFLDLHRAGLPVLEVVETLAQKERDGDFRTVLEGVAAVLREGRPLSAAFETFPSVFPPLYVATVRASERTGELALSLSRYVTYARQIDAVRKRVVNASIYPVLLLGTGGLVTLFLLFYVLPRFSHVYEERGLDLPLFSRLLLGWGELVQRHGGLLLAALVALAAAAVFVLRQPEVRAALAGLVWRFPPIGDRVKLFQLARFYRTVGMLLQGGMPMVAALQMGGDLLHPALRARLRLARQSISEGRPVSQSMEAHGLVTPIALRLLAVGEKGGDMGEMMLRIGAFHDEELTRWVDWFTRLFEPLLMAAIGLVIGAVVILMYLPIFELAGSLQ